MLLAVGWNTFLLADDLQKDPKFGQNGVVLQQTSPENYSTKFYDMIKLSNDKFVTGGITWIDGLEKLVLYRYGANGKLDTKFGEDGVAIADHVCNDGDEECGHFETEPGLEDIDGDRLEDIVWHGPSDSFFIWRMSRNGKVSEVDLGELPGWKLLP